MAMAKAHQDDNQKPNNNLEIFERLLSFLNDNSMSIYDYKKKVDSGNLSEKGFDDFIFEENNPEHPLATKNRMQRISMADRLFTIIAENPTVVSIQHLEVLHKIVFDCCASVRSSIVQALGNISREESVNVLKELIEVETDSKIVKAAAIEAIKIIKGDLKINEGPIIRSELVYSVDRKYLCT